MADRINAADTPASMTELVGGIVSDMQTLMRQELQLAKTEMRQEWDKTKAAAGAMAVGAGMLAVGAVLLFFALVYLINFVAPALPLWGCFAIVGGALVLLGGILVAIGRQKVAEVNVVPPQTAATMRENVQWLRNQT
jgi:cytochrome c biogenesis protein CcdA